ncbi:MAG: hypothetical protein WBQ85_17400 [Candidatus Sulfotelmatobacter sp.]
MEISDHAKIWSDYFAERQRLAKHRDGLETDLNETRRKLAHLDEILNHLRPLADMADTDEAMASLGITDAIRCVLRHSDERLSAQDVRQQLVDRGYDLSDLTAPLSSIYTILGRLSQGDDSEVEREKEEGRVYYKWKVPPITDEDIPF